MNVQRLFEAMGCSLLMMLGTAVGICLILLFAISPAAVQLGLVLLVGFVVGTAIWYQILNDPKNQEKGE